MQTRKSMIALLACTVLLSACGLRGPLYLPGEDPSARPPDGQVTDDDDLTVTKKKDRGIPKS